MTSAAELILQVDAQPAWADGHFPGDPILPGARLLDMVITALNQAGVLASPVCQIDQTKFTAPVRPGDTVRLSWTVTGNRVRYRCEVGPVVVAQGRITDSSNAVAAPRR